MILVMMLTISVPSTALADGQVTGRINASERPEITKVEIRSVDDYENSGYGEGSVTTTLTPNMYYDIVVGMNELGTFDNLSKLDIKLWYDATGTSNAKTKFDLVPNVSADSNTVAQTSSTIQLSYDDDNDDAVVTLDNTSDNTWDLYGTDQPTVTATSGSFIFRIKIGRVATEAESGNAPRWQVAAYAEDIYYVADYMAGATNTMNWYGETVVPDSHTIRWEDVEGGFNYTQSAAKEKVFTGEGDNEITYISNGDYSENVKVSTRWARSYGTETATSVARINTLNTDNSFAIKFDKVDGYASGTAIAIDDTSGSVVTPTEVTGTITAESGLSRSDYYMYLATSNTFPQSSVYDGTIVFGIANR
jgi:hypothetical protein